jgi:hypothetical protein
MKVKRKSHIICRKNIITKSMITQSIKSPIPMSNKNLHLLNPKNKKRNPTLTLLKIIILNMNKKTASTYISTLHQVKKRKKRRVSKVSIRMMTSQSQLLSHPRYWTITTLSLSINPQVTNRLSKIYM